MRDPKGRERATHVNLVANERQNVMAKDLHVDVVSIQEHLVIMATGKDGGSESKC